MQFNYNEEETTADNLMDELNDLNQQFYLVAGRYKTALTEFYLANTSENKNVVDEIKRMFTKIYAETFMLSSRINGAILGNNDNIQNLDEYIAKLKKEVDIENSTLSNVENSGLAAKPRKQYIRDVMQEDYYMDAFYFVAVLGTLYYFNYWWKDKKVET